MVIKYLFIVLFALSTSVVAYAGTGPLMMDFFDSDYLDTKPETSKNPGTQPGSSTNTSIKPDASKNPGMQPKTSGNPGTQPGTSDNPGAQPSG